MLGKIAAEMLIEVFRPERRAERKARRRARRKAKRGESLTEVEKELLMAEQVTVTLPDGSTTTRTEPLIPARTSTKVAAGSGVLAAFPAVELMQWVQSLELEPAWLEAATNSDYFVYYGAVLIATVIARFVKSPAAASKI